MSEARQAGHVEAVAHGSRLDAFARRVTRAVDRPDASLTIPERFSTETRAAQLFETLKLANYSLFAHLLVVMSLIPFFWDTACRGYVVSIGVVVSLLVGTAFCAVAILGPRINSAKAVQRGRWAAITFAFLIGLTWGTVPIALLPWSNDSHRIVVTSMITGVIADVFVLGPILPVAILFVLPIFAGTGIGLSLMGGFTGVCLLVLLGIFTFFAVFSIKQMNKLSVQRIFDRVQVSEQNETIGLLLREYEEATSDWLWEIDREGRLANASERIAQALGVPLAELHQQTFHKILQARSPNAQVSGGARKVFTAIAGRRPFHNMVIEIKTEGASIWWRLTGKPIYDKSGAFFGYRGVGSDITLTLNAEQKIAYMAKFDALTGLANRSVFLSLAGEDCGASGQTRARRALLYLDLDGFKGINDSLGHAIGDRLLIEVAERLKSAVPNGALLARLGGDEFAVLLPVVRRSEAETLAQALIWRIGAPFHIDGSEADIGLSIGIAFAPDDSESPDSLLVKADLALYSAKAEGKARYRIFVEEMERSLNERRAFENELRVALPRGELELVYQPLVNLNQGRVVCFEALLRWNSPSRGKVSPVAFIPVAETIGLIVSIGRWVLWQACTEAARWDSDVSIAVNISPQHFRMPDFLSDVSVALGLSGLDPSRLEIEITEGVFLEDCDAALENLHALRKRGIRIALDDFGTGYSSLNYLINFPVDKIKIDRTFVRDFLSRNENRAIIDAILTLARELSIKVTAEGVETVDQAIALRARRCDDIQGYLLGVPKPASAVADTIETIPIVYRELLPARQLPPMKMVQQQTA